MKNLPSPLLKQFIRAKDGQPIGILLAFKEGNDYKIGWSLTAVKRGDKFNKALGERIALSRAMSSNLTNIACCHGVPTAVHNAMFPLMGKRNFPDRCLAYFKV